MTLVFGGPGAENQKMYFSNSGLFTSPWVPFSKMRARLSKRLQEREEGMCVREGGSDLLAAAKVPAEA